MNQRIKFPDVMEADGNVVVRRVREKTKAEREQDFKAPEHVQAFLNGHFFGGHVRRGKASAGSQRTAPPRATSSTACRSCSCPTAPSAAVRAHSCKLAGD